MLRFGFECEINCERSKTESHANSYLPVQDLCACQGLRGDDTKSGKILASLHMPASSLLTWRHSCY